MLGDIVRQVSQKRLRITFAQSVWHRPDQHGGRTEAFDHQTEFRKAIDSLFKSIAIDLIQLDHIGYEERLRTRDRIPGPSRTQPFQDEPFMRCMLIHQNQAIIGFRHDVSVGNLPPGNAKREVFGSLLLFRFSRATLWTKPCATRKSSAR